jgi:hypothetical protein
VTLDAKTYPVEILERTRLTPESSVMVRVNGIRGWIPEDQLTPCGSCGGARFLLLEGVYGEAVRRNLRCPKCAPPDRRRQESVLAVLRLPAVDLSGRAP